MWTRHITYMAHITWMRIVHISNVGVIISTGTLFLPNTGIIGYVNEKRKILECSIFTLYCIIVIIKVTIIIERAIKLAWFERKLGIEGSFESCILLELPELKGSIDTTTCIIIWSRLWLMTCLDTALNIDTFKYK